MSRTCDMSYSILFRVWLDNIDSASFLKLLHILSFLTIDRIWINSFEVEITLRHYVEQILISSFKKQNLLINTSACNTAINPSLVLFPFKVYTFSYILRSSCTQSLQGVVELTLNILETLLVHWALSWLHWFRLLSIDCFFLEIFLFSQVSFKLALQQVMSSLETKTWQCSQLRPTKPEYSFNDLRMQWIQEWWTKDLSNSSIFSYHETKCVGSLNKCVHHKPLIIYFWTADQNNNILLNRIYTFFSMLCSSASKSTL